MEQFFQKDRPVNINEEHTLAEDLMFEADRAALKGNEGQHKELSLQAALLEEKSLYRIPFGNLRTRAILGNSAVALYFRGGNFEKAKELGEKLLSDPTLIGQDYNLNDIKQIIENIDSIQPLNE